MVRNYGSNRKKDTSNIRQTEPSPIVFSTYTNYKLWTKKDLVILDKTIRPEKYHFDLSIHMCNFTFLHNSSQNKPLISNFVHQSEV